MCWDMSGYHQKKTQQCALNYIWTCRIKDCILDSKLISGCSWSAFDRKLFHLITNFGGDWLLRRLKWAKELIKKFKFFNFSIWNLQKFLFLSSSKHLEMPLRHNRLLIMHITPWTNLKFHVIITHCVKSNSG